MLSVPLLLCCSGEICEVMGHVPVLFVVKMSECSYLLVLSVRCNISEAAERNLTKFGIEVKGKAIQLQPWTGPEGSRRIRFPDFKTVGT